MINTFLRFNTVQTRCLFNAGAQVSINNHHIVLKVKPENVTGDIILASLTNQGASEVQSDNTVHIGVSLSQLSYNDLLSFRTPVIRLCVGGIPTGYKAYRTKNPHLFMVMCDDSSKTFYTIRKTPHDLPMSLADITVKGGTVLERMLTDHDWYYSYSDDSGAYRRGEQQRKEIINRLKYLEVDDPEGMYLQLAKCH